MRILLFGKNGQVGWELQRSLASLGDVIAVDYPEVDFADLKGLRNSTLEKKPDLIVNAAAYTEVDKAESEPEIAMRVNGEAPGVLAAVANILNVGLVHYSTDYVFDGMKSAPYTEEDEPKPINVYGQTKLAGDLAIQESGCAHLILRTSWVYGARGKNFFLTMLRLAREQKVIKVVDDQIGSPTWSHTIAEVTGLILNKGFRPDRDQIEWDDMIPTGVYNYSSSGSTQWHDFAAEILRTDPLKSEHIVERLEPISTRAFNTPAARPRYSELSKARIETVFDIRPGDWRDQLNACWQLYKS